MTIKRRSLCILTVASLPLISFGFTPVSSPSPLSLSHHNYHRRPIVPIQQQNDFSPIVSLSSGTSARTTSSTLFVAQGQGQPDSPVLKQIEKEMEKMRKSRDKYAAQISKFDSGLQALETKKNQYLEGLNLGNISNNFSETTLRSAVKSMMWRVIAGTVTLITSLKFSGNLSTALQIVGSDFFSKAATMFIGERIMNKSQAGRKKGADSAKRSLTKALLWRLFAIANTLTVSYFFAKDLKMASKIAGSDAVFKTALMFFYERAWAKIEWGKEYIVEFSI